MSEIEGYKLEEKKEFSNGVIYEWWCCGVDNVHHIHLPDGMTISFGHEDSEGDVVIEEKSKERNVTAEGDS